MINFFLNRNNEFKIEIFSIYHILLICLTLLIIILIIINKNKFINLNEKKKKNIRLSLAIIIILNFILRRGSFIYFGVYDWRYHLDINFCNFTSIMFLIYSFSGNKKIYNICYYMAFIGPLLSILFPSVNINPYNYSFYSFLILHYVVFIYNYIFMYMENLIFDFNKFLKVFKFLILYFLTIYFFDYLAGTNYNVLDSFININITNIKFVHFIISNFIIEVVFSIFLFLLMLFVGILNLKFFNNKKNFI